MTEVKILVQGYAKLTQNEEHASSTVVLIRDEKNRMIVDPGMDHAALLMSLKNEGLTTSEITHVLLSHAHLDHSLLAGTFENAVVIDSTSLYTFEGKITPHQNVVPGTEVQIIPTPGHSDDHCSFLVSTQAHGNVVIAADVFWWEDTQKQLIEYKKLIHVPDSYATNKRALKKSREKILKLADYIIPGHGAPFVAPRQ